MKPRNEEREIDSGENSRDSCIESSTQNKRTPKEQSKFEKRHPFSLETNELEEVWILAIKQFAEC